MLSTVTSGSPRSVMTRLFRVIGARHIPCGNAVNAATGEFRTFEIRFNQHCPTEVRPAEIRSDEFTLVRFAPTRFSAGQVRLEEVGF